MKLYNEPTTAKEAKSMGMEWYQSHIVCSIHGLKPRWVNTEKPMCCFDWRGEPHECYTRHTKESA